MLGVFTSGDSFFKRVLNLKETATNTSLEDLKEKRQELQERYSLTNYFKNKTKLIVDHQISLYEAKVEEIQQDLSKTAEEKKKLIDEIRVEHNYDNYQKKVKELTDEYRQRLKNCDTLLNQFKTKYKIDDNKDCQTKD